MAVKDRVSSAATVAAGETDDLDQGPHQRKPVAAVSGRLGGELETDTESGGSSMEDGESPRPVVSMWRWRKASASGCLHSQVLRVMEEDLHLGEDVVVNGVKSIGSHADPQMAILPRPTLPCSPLSGRGSAGKTVR